VARETDLLKTLTRNGKVRLEIRRNGREIIVCAWGMDIINRISWRSTGKSIREALLKANKS
jgi:hypothetical protein